MSLASQVSAAMTRIGTEFKSVRTAIAGKASVDSTFGAEMRSQALLTGGGTIAVNGSNEVSWTQRFMIIGGGNGAHFSTTGYFDIGPTPAAGTVITGVGGSGNITVTAGGIPLNTWNALYYILPIGNGNGFIPGNLRISTYTGALTVPDNWVLLATKNGDNNQVRFGNGVALQPGESWTAANPVSTARLIAVGSYVGNTAYNNMTDAGWYVMDATATNAPVATVCYLEVRSWGSPQVEQVARVCTGANTGDTYTRYMQGSVWGAWVKKTAHGLSDVTWTTVACTNSWVGNYQYARRAGLVTVNLITPTKATYAANDIIASGANALPAGFRPIGSFVVKGANASGVNEDRSWYIDSVGVIRAAAAGSVSMNGTCTYIPA